MDFHYLDVLIDTAGGKPSAINNAVVSLLLDKTLTYDQAMSILKPTRELGATLSAIQGWSDLAQRPAKPGLTVVADVNGEDPPQYTGPVDASRLTLGNLAFIDRNLGGFSNKWGQVFNAKPRFPDQQGVLANATPDPMTPDGYDLNTFLRTDAHPA